MSDKTMTEITAYYSSLLADCDSDSRVLFDYIQAVAENIRRQLVAMATERDASLHEEKAGEVVWVNRGIGLHVTGADAICGKWKLSVSKQHQTNWAYVLYPPHQDSVYVKENYTSIDQAKLAAENALRELTKPAEQPAKPKSRVEESMQPLELTPKESAMMEGNTKLKQIDGMNQFANDVSV